MSSLRFLIDSGINYRFEQHLLCTPNKERLRRGAAFPDNGFSATN